MIGEVNKALAAYEALDAQGKKLFRGELGLVRPQQATKRRVRKAKGDNWDKPKVDPNFAPHERYITTKPARVRKTGLTAGPIVLRDAPSA